MSSVNRKLRLSRFEGKGVRWIIVGSIFYSLFSCAPCSVRERGLSVTLDRFPEEFIVSHAEQIGRSGQLVFATNRDASSFRVTILALEKKNGVWRLVLPELTGSIGKNGFASIDEKSEGDGKSPSGIFPLGIAFGYDPSVKTRMEYRKATDDDFWVDDVNSEDYNQWVKGKPNATSWEKMKREDDQYKYGVVIEYNMHPVVKGQGSAIFLHVWEGGGATSGCVSMSEEMILSILEWLDPAKKPLIIMGTESELNAAKFR